MPSGHSGPPTRAPGPAWAGEDADGEYPQWADPGPHRDGRDPGPPAGGARRRVGRGAWRAAARGRQRLFIWGGLAVAGALVGVIVVILVGKGGPGNVAPIPNALVTTFLPGEFQTVPNACGAVPATILDTYLPGKVTKAVPPSLEGSADSQCDWTADSRPMYRVLEADVHAYAPSGLASGTGSATFAALDAYSQAQRAMINPARNSGQPKAQVATVPGLGNQGFSATQVFSSGGDVNDVVTVVVRDRNVLVTVRLQGLDRSGSGGYGPVSVTELRLGALAAARDALGRLG